jgi:SPP1 gp7 family putative phage head morphogenesis protein
MGFLDKVFLRTKPIQATKPLMDTELAITEEAIWKRMKLVPYQPDNLFNKKKIQIYNDMMYDAEIESSINTLKTIRLSSGWDIQPASDSPIHREQADFVKHNFENVEGSFEDDLREIMGAVEMGVSISEIVLHQFEKGTWKNKIGLKALKCKNPKYFNLFVDDFDNLRENGVVNISSIDYGQQYPTEKFCIYSFNKKYENVFGTSRIRSLYDLWFIKNIIMKAWGVYLEKFGHPLPIIKHPPLDDITKQNLLEALRQIRYETGLLVPKDLELEIKEASGRGADVHKACIDYINEQIRKTILGQTLTSSTSGQGSYSLGAVHFDILLFYEEQLGKDVSSQAINEQLIKRLIDYNYVDVEDYPKFQFKPLVQKNIEGIIDKYFIGIEKGVLKPIPEDENLIREWLNLPKRKEAEAPAPVVQQTPQQAQQPTDRQQAQELTRELEKSGFEVVNKDMIFKEVEKFQEKIFTGVGRRRFTPYEEATDFVEAKSIHEVNTERYATKIGEFVQRGMSDLTRQIQKNRIIEDKNFDAFKSLALSTTGDIKNEFHRMLTEGYEQSVRQARQEIMNKKRKKNNYSELIKFQYEMDLRKITPEEALKYFEAKSFDMAGIERNYILEKVRTTLYNTIKTGATLRDTIEELQRQLSPYYERGLVGDEALRGYRLETVVRTNLNEAFNEGRKGFFEAPELEGYVVAYQYSAILDDRVRPNHACMDGRIYSVNSPIWDTHTPPNGFNCRCILIPITTDEEWQEDDRPPKSCDPDAGFSKPAVPK